jgi:IS605 OrfB family transposase
MYLTQKNQIRGLSKGEYTALRYLCRLTKNLYNVGLYSVRQFFFAERRYLCYEGNYHACKENENYRLLNTDIAQQTLKVVDRSFKSFFKRLEQAQKGIYRFEQIRLPNYLKKDGYFPLIIPRIKVKEGYFEVPMSRQFRSEHGSIRIPLPERLQGKKLKETRIIPKHDGRWFEVEFVIEQEPEHAQVEQEKAMAVDFGIDNLATCVKTTGASLIVDGKKLKSINQGFNRINSRVQSSKDVQGIKGLTNYQASLYQKRSNRVRDYLNKAARVIINHCLTNRIGTLVVGVNPGWKESINIGSKNNQNFVSIPHWQLKSKLNGLCERYSIKYVEQEESYTSKASALDGDDLPVFNADHPVRYTFSGKRVRRGLYQTKDGHFVNSDCNGAWNIGRKSKHEGFTGVSRGALAAPLRVFIS